MSARAGKILWATRGRGHGVRLAGDYLCLCRRRRLIHDGVDGFVLRYPRDAQTLSQLIERLQAEPDLRHKIGEAASKTILEWDLES